MEFQEELCNELRKTWLKAHGYIILDTEQDVAKAQASINELIKDIVNKDMITVKPSGGDDTSQAQKAIDTIDSAEYFRKKLLSAFGINKEEEKSDG